MSISSKRKTPSPGPSSHPRRQKNPLGKSCIVFLVGLLFTALLWNLVVGEHGFTTEGLMVRTSDKFTEQINQFLATRLQKLESVGRALAYIAPVSDVSPASMVEDMKHDIPESLYCSHRLIVGHRDWDEISIDPSFTLPNAFLVVRDNNSPIGEQAYQNELRAKVFSIPGTDENLHAVRSIIYRHGRPYLLTWTIVDTPKLLRAFFAPHQTTFYHYVVTSHWNTLATNLGFHDDVTKQRPYKKTRLLSWGGYALWLNIWPTPEYLSRRTLNVTMDMVAIIVLSVGFFFSISIGLLTWTVSTRTSHLERAVASRTVDLDEKNILLQQRNEEIRSFIYSVSHDLKSPVVSIQGFANILKDEFGKKMGDSGISYLERIRANSAKMYRMINDLLELSKIGHVDETAEDINTAQLVGDILDEHHVEIVQRRIHFKVGPNLPYVAYPRLQMQQVFDNLISNAIKYFDGKKSPEIKIETNGHQTDTAFHHFVVSDNGVGIAREDQEKIFQIFRRVHQEKNVEGTGVGLSIVKKIVEHHGGSVHVESVLGRGSKFEFTIPKKV